MSDPLAEPPLDVAQARALLDCAATAAWPSVDDSDSEDYLDPSHEGGLDQEFMAAGVTTGDLEAGVEEDWLDDPSHDGGLDPDWA